MTAGNTGRTVALALADVARWRADEEARQKAEMIEVEQEMKNLQATIRDLEQKLESLGRFGVELQGRKQALPDQELQRARESVISALRDQSRRISDRDRLVQQAATARRSALEAKLAEPEVVKNLAAYRKFKETEEQIAKLDEAYTRAIFEVHERVVQSLQMAIGPFVTGPVKVDGEPIPADLVYAIDAPEGAPDLVVLLLPVDESASAEWVEGVQLWIMGRALQAVYEACADTGWHGIQADSGGYEGLLVIEIDVAGAPKAWIAAFETRLRAAFTNPPELMGARLAVVPTSLDMDYLSPPQGAEDDDAG